MPNARFQLNADDIATAVAQHRSVIAARNPIYTTAGYALTPAVVYILFKWLMERGLGWTEPRDGILFGYLVVPVLVGTIAAVTTGAAWRFVDPRHFRWSPMWRAPMDIDWGAAGVNANPDAPGLIAWRAFKRWSEVDGMILLYIRAHRYLILPARAFADGELALMRSYLERAGVPEAGKSWWRPLFGLQPTPETRA